MTLWADMHLWDYFFLSWKSLCDCFFPFLGEFQMISGLNAGRSMVVEICLQSVICIAGIFFTSWATREPKHTRVGSLSLLQWIFPTQESNQGLLHCRRILYQLSYQGSPLYSRPCTKCRATLVSRSQSLLSRSSQSWVWALVMTRNRNASLSTVQFSRSVMSNSLRPHESQHARPPCPSPTPEVHSDSRPSRQWCHPAISSSVVPFSSCPQSLPEWVNSLHEVAKVLEFQL